MASAERIFRWFVGIVVSLFLIPVFVLLGWGFLDNLRTSPRQTLEFLANPASWIFLFFALVIGLVLVAVKQSGRRREPQRILLAASLLFAGFLFAVPGFIDYRFGSQSENWARTEGTVSLSRIVSRTTRSRGTTTPYSYAEIRYAYHIGGRDYVSERITGDSIDFLGARIISRWTSNASEAQRLITRYPSGRTVKVYYDPRDPRRSLLEPGVTASALRNAILGSVLMIAGLALSFAIWRGDERDSDVPAA